MLGWFGKRRKERQLLEFMLKFISYNTRLTAVSANPETRQHHLHRRGAGLRPILPLAAGENYRSWLGGCPHLPDPFSWPQRDGKPLNFLGQIDCAALPRGIWGGVGPRTGWLAFFVGMAEGICAEVVHAPQLGPKRTPPAKSRFYFLPSMLGAVPEVYDEIPQWPVDVVACADGDPDPYQSIVTNPALHPEIDLGQAQFQPYDWDTFLALLKTAKAAASSNINFNTRYLLSDLARANLPEPDVAVRERVLNAATPRLQRCRDAIAANEQIERGLTALIGKADASRAAPFLMTQWADAFAMVQAPEIGEPHWTTEYDAIRYRLAALAYSRDPASLPDTVRSYFEARWKNDRNYEIASMGGLPHGWSYDMLENVDTRVMLLELPTSKMFGWQWGDVNNVVLSLPVDELRRNIYRDVRCDITN
jgi:hypothetical protein